MIEGPKVGWKNADILGYHNYSPDGGEEGRDGYYDVLITDALQAVLHVPPNGHPLAEVVAAYQRHGWHTEVFDFASVKSDSDAHRILKERLKWPEWTKPGFHVYNEFITDFDAVTDKTKMCLILDVRTCSPWLHADKLMAAMLNQARHARSVFGRTYPEGGLCLTVVTFIWYGPSEHLPTLLDGHSKSATVIRPGPHR